MISTIRKFTRKFVIKLISASLPFVVFAASESKGNWHLAMLARSLFWLSKEIFLINWSYRSNSQMYMMCFMSLNFAGVSKILSMGSIMRS